VDDRGSIPGRGNDGIFLFATVSGPALGSTHPPIKCVSGAVFLGLKRPAREVHLQKSSWRGA
jgi:hypothetical protein